MSHAPVIIVHYHLRAAGVPKVIAHTSAGLTTRGIPHVILSGEKSDEPLPIHVIDGLDYPESISASDAPDLLRRMRAAVTAAFGKDAPLAIWHVHNHTVGLHATIVPIVRTLAISGSKLVLHTHDFAEDGRLENFARTGHQPAHFHAPHVATVCLNSFDRETLLASGYPPDSVTVLPNAVPPANTSPAATSQEALVLYPVRAITRKNLAEICLLAAAAKSSGLRARFAVGLAADEPAHFEIYNFWKRVIAELDLPIDLDVSDRLESPRGGKSFQSWIASSTHFATTSLAEGFGMIFLEAQNHRRPLFGRDLPHIRQDLLAKGAGLGTFYSRLDIGGRDFAMLPPDRQREIVTNPTPARIDSSAGPPLDVWLRRVLADRTPPPPLPTGFAIEAYIDSLLGIYDSLGSPRPITTIPRTDVFAAFTSRQHTFP